MLPYKKIICPTDFSEPSYVALDDAIELARLFGASLCVVHVVRPFPVGMMDTGYGYYDYSADEQATLVESRKKLHEIIQQRVPREIHAFSVTKLGPEAEEIVSVAQRHGADLIVIATHGLNGWRHLVFGSVAERVVQTAPCAVLTVHRPPDAPVQPEVVDVEMSHADDARSILV